MAEGGGLLNRYTVQSRIKGSNPFLSATLRPSGFGWQAKKRLLETSEYRPPFIS